MLKIQPPGVIVALLLSLCVPIHAQADWGERLRGALPGNNGAQAPASGQEAGLRDLLGTSSDHAVSMAGQQGGFLDNPGIRIPLPGILKDAQGLLSRLGLSQQLDDLETAINAAAERAAPAARPILAEAVRDLRFEDVQPILGAADGATRHLQDRQGERVTQALLPETRHALQETGATQALSSLIDRIGTRLPGISALQDFDLDTYVNDQTVAGLFDLMAEREGMIREDPMGQGGQMLRGLFGR
ncbi:hypothetical protein ECTPHS_04463 [Ectothiorhodospira sp. PHS-1]|uniref:DUF4197 domain-containing protein n=1 Tax=Ectothiorhodospira sp. PHS-1 TaxID=519989 RepID=UPI00024A8992|nr:DUF4197 domain-containing protein [Ectothiorhodospira sp. PHS-1]EHQ51920.1 hypothetical protein ECTPHS_04463 [Ectothiorhodospira sp. PHS-1]